MEDDQILSEIELISKSLRANNEITDYEALDISVRILAIKVSQDYTVYKRENDKKLGLEDLRNKRKDLH